MQGFANGLERRRPHGIQQYEKLHRPRDGRGGALELAGNLPAFDDGVCHPTINLDRIDPECALPNLVANEPRDLGRVNVILNNSFGMLGINSAVIVKKFEG